MLCYFCNYRMPANSIAIGCAVTSRNIPNLSITNAKLTLPILRTFLPSFCSTASVDYSYYFYLSYDNDDDLFSMEATDQLTNNTYSFVEVFQEVLQESCATMLNVSTIIIVLSILHV